jgi:hypothetical protein
MRRVIPAIILALAAIPKPQRPHAQARIPLREEPTPTAPERPRTTTVQGAVAREMARCLADGLRRSAPPGEMKAYFDAVRRAGPEAIAPLIAALADADPQAKLAALNALCGLRALWRDVPERIEEGLLVDDVARQLGVPVDTVLAVRSAGPWSGEATAAMARGAKDLAAPGHPEEIRRNAITALAMLEAPELLAALIADLRPEPELRRVAIDLAAPSMPGLARAIALDETEPVDVRLRAGAASARMGGDVRALLPLARREAVDPAAPAERRSAAIEVVARLAPEREAEDLLCALLGHRDEGTRLLALGAIASIGRPTASVQEALRAIAAAEPGAAQRVAQRIATK